MQSKASCARRRWCPGSTAGFSLVHTLLVKRSVSAAALLDTRAGKAEHCGAPPALPTCTDLQALKGRGLQPLPNQATAHISSSPACAPQKARAKPGLGGRANLYLKLMQDSQHVPCHYTVEACTISPGTDGHHSSALDRSVGPKVPVEPRLSGVEGSNGTRLRCAICSGEQELWCAVPGVSLHAARDPSVAQSLLPEPLWLPAIRARCNFASHHQHTSTRSKLCSFDGTATWSRAPVALG
jgi:hypothetical protein